MEESNTHITRIQVTTNQGNQMKRTNEEGGVFSPVFETQNAQDEIVEEDFEHAEPLLLSEEKPWKKPRLNGGTSQQPASFSLAIDSKEEEEEEELYMGSIEENIAPQYAPAVAVPPSVRTMSRVKKLQELSALAVAANLEKYFFIYIRRAKQSNYFYSPYMNRSRDLILSRMIAMGTLNEKNLAFFLDPRINEIHLKNCKFGNTLLEALKASENLVYLDLENCNNLSSGALINLSSQFANRLYVLNLSGCYKVTDETLSIICSNLSLSLKSLNLSGCFDLTSKCMKSIATCKGLVSLNLSFCPLIFNDGIEQLSEGCTLLESLDISHCSEIVSLDSLALRCNNLKKLSLRGCNGLTDFSLERICTQSVQLQEIDLSDCQLLSSSLIEKLVTNCKKISYLNLSFLKSVNDVCVVKAAFYLGEHLRTLLLRECIHVSDEAIEHLVKNCINLEELNLDSCNLITDNALKNLSNLKNLRSLDVSFCRKVTIPGLKTFLHQISSSSHSFQQLSIWGFSMSKTILASLQTEAPQILIQCISYSKENV